MIRRLLARYRLNRKMKPDPDLGLLRQAIEYDPETGNLTWATVPPLEYFTPHAISAEDQQRVFARKRLGRPAFNTPCKIGYRKGCFQGREYYAHRVAWALHTGTWPKGEIDHINGDKIDNRIANLREVTKVENGRNMPLPANNTSGQIGVSWSKTDKRWTAYIKVGGRRRFLGNFLEKDDAIAARKAAEARFGFHPNHGRAA